MSELLAVRDLAVSFRTDGGPVPAVRGVSFDVRRGETFAVVGESGSGKSATAMAIMGLLPPSATVSGSIALGGRDLLRASEEERRRVRGGEVAMIFQDPMSALNPVQTVGRQIAEMVRAHAAVSRRDALGRAVELLDLVGIPRPAERARSYPHELSGGMRQRAMIAMAVANRPALLIADEPTTALDVTVQAQVLEVLLEIKQEIDSAILLITHDLGVVAGVAERVMVMYAGTQVETGSVDQVFYESHHPYTLGLLASLPRVDGSSSRLHAIAGSPPSLVGGAPAGCPFHPRCAFRSLPSPCATDVPPLLPVASSPGLASACHFADRVGEEGLPT